MVQTPVHAGIHRHVDLLAGTKIEDVGGKLRFDWTEFDDMADYCMHKCHFDALALPGDVFAYHQARLRPANMVGRRTSRPTRPSIGPRSRSRWPSTAGTWQKGWTDKFIFYICDEPNVVVFPYLLRVAEIARRKMPGVHILWIGGWVYPELIGKFDIWGPNTRFLRSRPTRSGSPPGTPSGRTPMPFGSSTRPRSERGRWAGRMRSTTFPGCSSTASTNGRRIRTRSQKQFHV